MQSINTFQIYFSRVQVIHYILISAKFQWAVAEKRVLSFWESLINIITQNFLICLSYLFRRIFKSFFLSYNISDSSKMSDKMQFYILNGQSN